MIKRIAATSISVLLLSIAVGCDKGGDGGPMYPYDCICDVQCSDVHVVEDVVPVCVTAADEEAALEWIGDHCIDEAPTSCLGLSPPDYTHECTCTCTPRGEESCE